MNNLCRSSACGQIYALSYGVFGLVWANAQQHSSTALPTYHPAFMAHGSTKLPTISEPMSLLSKAKPPSSYSEPGHPVPGSSTPLTQTQQAIVTVPSPHPEDITNSEIRAKPTTPSLRRTGKNVMKSRASATLPGSPTTTPVAQLDPPPTQQATGTLSSPHPGYITLTPNTETRPKPTIPSQRRTGKNVMKSQALATLPGSPTATISVAQPDPPPTQQITGTLSSPHPDDIALTPNSETPDKPTTPSHRRTGEKITMIWLMATLPLLLHFTSVLALLAVVMIYIDKHDFNLESRSPLSTHTPLQSDITTAISSGITISRFFATMWSAATLWRCIFILMGKGGISLEQIDNLLTFQIHRRPYLKSSQQFGLLISIILLAALPIQLSGPILTGSVTWSPSYRLTEGQRATNIPSYSLGDLNGTYFYSGPSYYLRGCSLASGFAGTAWRDSLEDERTMKRVIRSISHLPINSTLRNISLPYFAITKLEWVRETTRVIPPMLENSSDLNPFNAYVGPGVFTLIPDIWGDVVVPSPYTGIISETRTIAGIFKADLFGDKPPNIGCYRIGTPQHCMVFGRVSYVAGAAECRNCRVSSWVTVKNDTILTVEPSEEAVYAISMMPMVMAMMTLQNNSLPPQSFNRFDEYITELLIRSYAGSWTSIRQYPSAAINNPSSTDVQIAIPTSRANVALWRVGLWLSLNLLFTLSGLLFLFMQRMSGEQLVGSPSLVALLLDTTEVLHKRDRAFCNISKLTKEDKGIGYLRFARNSAQNGHRQVEIVE